MSTNGQISELEDPTDERLSVARRVYAIVATFADPSLRTPYSVDFFDRERLAALLDGKSAEQLEQEVAALASEAEGNTVPWPHTEHVVTAALHSESLIDDYMRMKSGQQWMAFEEAGAL